MARLRKLQRMMHTFNKGFSDQKNPEENLKKCWKRINNRSEYYEI